MLTFIHSKSRAVDSLRQGLCRSISVLPHGWRECDEDSKGLGLEKSRVRKDKAYLAEEGFVLFVRGVFEQVFAGFGDAYPVFLVGFEAHVLSHHVSVNVGLLCLVIPCYLQHLPCRIAPPACSNVLIP